ncbi:MAG: stage V sporulation protein AC [Christensenellaceae bacterium]|jgi:stage V sporulation protein AC|nr:stage V sporulation protein AC [Christensenellaceae bacterium]
MNEPNKEYLKLIKEKMPKTKHFSTIVRAFIIGGLICCIGEALNDIYGLIFKTLSEDEIKSIVTITIILITAILTSFGIYDKIGNFGGAGSIIPITGFANAVVSPAIEHKKEGIILGLCSNMFKIAGPIIVVGITSSICVGIFVLFFKGAF